MKYPNKVCHECAIEAGGELKHDRKVEWTDLDCDVCGDQDKPVTDPCSYGRPLFTFEDKQYGDEGYKTAIAHRYKIGQTVFDSAAECEVQILAIATYGEGETRYFLSDLDRRGTIPESQLRTDKAEYETMNARTQYRKAQKIVADYKEKYNIK